MDIFCYNAFLMPVRFESVCEWHYKWKYNINKRVNTCTRTIPQCIGHFGIYLIVFIIHAIKHKTYYVTTLSIINTKDHFRKEWTLRLLYSGDTQEHHIPNLSNLTRGKLEIFGCKVLTQISSGVTVVLIHFNANFWTKNLEFSAGDVTQI